MHFKNQNLSESELNKRGIAHNFLVISKYSLISFEAEKLNPQIGLKFPLEDNSAIFWFKGINLSFLN